MSPGIVNSFLLPLLLPLFMLGLCNHDEGEPPTDLAAPGLLASRTGLSIPSRAQGAPLVLLMSLAFRTSSLRSGCSWSSFACQGRSPEERRPEQEQQLGPEPGSTQRFPVGLHLTHDLTGGEGEREGLGCYVLGDRTRDGSRSCPTHVRLGPCRGGWEF